MTSTRNKRKKKIKVHYDRLLAQVVLLAAIVFVVAWLITKCSRSYSSDYETHIPFPEVVDAARADAMKAVEAPAGSMQRENALLFIKSRETELRYEGYGHEADDYIKIATEILSDHGIE